MDIKERTKEALDQRIKKVEDLIADKGVGSTYLRKAKRTQRNINLAIVVGSALSLAGLLAWSLSGSDED